MACQEEKRCQYTQKCHKRLCVYIYIYNICICVYIYILLPNIGYITLLYPICQYIHYKQFVFQLQNHLSVMPHSSNFRNHPWHGATTRLSLLLPLGSEQVIDLPQETRCMQPQAEPHPPGSKILQVPNSECRNGPSFEAGQRKPEITWTSGWSMSICLEYLFGMFRSMMVV